jgi:hypothetical protein
VTRRRNDAHLTSLATLAPTEATTTEEPRTMPATSTSRRRTDAGRVAPHVIGAVALVVLIVCIGVWTATSGQTDDPAPGSPSAGPGEPTSGAAATTGPGEPAEDCLDTGTVPLVDLGVQAATGDPEDPQLTDDEVAALVTLAKDAGADVISTTASFRALKPVASGAYRYDGMDRVIRAAREAGLEVRLRLMTMPRWALDEPNGTLRQPPRTDPELERWAQFVRDVMTHVDGQVGYVEVWNEPNAQKYWTTGPDPVEFARLLSVTSDAIEEVAPDTVVVSGGINGNDIGFLEQTYAAFDTIGLDASPVDQVGIHPFAGAAPPAAVDEGEIYERDPYGLFDNNFTGFESMHDVMADHGDADKPLFITAFGYSTRGVENVAGVDDATRAGFLSEAFDIVTCSDVVAGMSWYAFHPTPWDPASWTLLDAQNRPNRTYAALQTWVAGAR